VRLLFAFAGNEGHLQPMRYPVLSPFPLSNGDHVGPTTHFLPIRAGTSTSAASSLLDQLAAGQSLIGDIRGDQAIEDAKYSAPVDGRSMVGRDGT
jgi:hypothetical protein